jgi:hypothetical protein
MYMVTDEELDEGAGSVLVRTDGCMYCVLLMRSHPFEVRVPLTRVPRVLVVTTPLLRLGPERTLATGTLTHRVTVVWSSVDGVSGTVGSGVVGSAGGRGVRGTWGAGAAWAVGARATTGAVAAVTAISVRDRLRVRVDIEHPSGTGTGPLEGASTWQ